MADEEQFQQGPPEEQMQQQQQGPSEALQIDLSKPPPGLAAGAPPRQEPVAAASHGKFMTVAFDREKHFEQDGSGKLNDSGYEHLNESVAAQTSDRRMRMEMCRACACSAERMGRKGAHKETDQVNVFAWTCHVRIVGKQKEEDAAAGGELKLNLELKK